MPEYRYREGYRGPKKVDPAVVIGIFDRLESTGSLTAARVVEAAEPKDSVIHDQFEWDNAVAGKEYRLIQARTLIRAVIVVPDPEAPEELAEPRYIHVPDEEGPEGKYVRAEVVVHREDEFERALTEARRHLESAESRVNELRRLAKQIGGRVEALAIAAQGLSAVREALEILRAELRKETEAAAPPS